eukprot:4418050-Amphidinium_carterae.2
MDLIPILHSNHSLLSNASICVSSPPVSFPFVVMQVARGVRVAGSSCHEASITRLWHNQSRNEYGLHKT